MVEPESAKDFASQMKGCFVLKGPRRPVEMTEGGNTVDFNENTNTSTSVVDNLPEPDHQEIVEIHIRHYEPPKCIVDGRLCYELVTIL